MMDRIIVQGCIRIFETDVLTGITTMVYQGENVVTTVGLSMIAERLRGNTAISGVAEYALGGDSTPPVAGNTALIQELYRGQVTQSRVAGGELKITLHLGATQGNGLTFREGGAFNAEGTLLCRAIYPDKEKTSSKELTIVHSILFAAA